ncbi:MAG: class I SAM-dependent methyltransferase, partial [Methanobacteriota archaeon]
MPLRGAAARATGAKEGDRVLDLACGTGLGLAALRRLVGATGEVVGVDVSADMLERAGRRIARAGWRNVRTVLADAASMPFPDSSFDHAVSSYSMNVIPDYAGAIAESRRVVRPGGSFGPAAASSCSMHARA